MKTIRNNKMKAWTIYWASGPKNSVKKNHGSTTVVGPDIVASTILFVDKFPNREISSISSESDEVLLYIVT